MSTVHFVDLSAPGCLLSRPVCTLWARDGVTVRLSSTIHFRGQPLRLYNVPWVAHAEFRGQILRLCVPWVAHAEFSGQPLRLYYIYPLGWDPLGRTCRIQGLAFEIMFLGLHMQSSGVSLWDYMCVPWVALADFRGQPLRLYMCFPWVALAEGSWDSERGWVLSFLICQIPLSVAFLAFTTMLLPLSVAFLAFTTMLLDSSSKVRNNNDC